MIVYFLAVSFCYCKVMIYPSDDHVDSRVLLATGASTAPIMKSMRESILSTISTIHGQSNSRMLSDNMEIQELHGLLGFTVDVNIDIVEPVHKISKVQSTAVELSADDEYSSATINDDSFKYEERYAVESSFCREFVKHSGDSFLCYPDSEASLAAVDEVEYLSSESSEGFLHRRYLRDNKKPVVVAVLDTGLSTEGHSFYLFENPGEIPDNQIDDDKNGFTDDCNGWNFAGGAGTNLDDYMGHGTHVAGLVHQMYWQYVKEQTTSPPTLRILTIRVFAGRTTDTSILALGLNYLALMQDKVDFANHSYTTKSTGRVSGLHHAFSRITSVMSVAAAGNDGIMVDSYSEVAPCDFSKRANNLNLYCIGNVELGRDRKGTLNTNVHRYASSNYSPTYVGNSAVGVRRTSTCLGGRLCRMTGTSMSSPIVAGIMAARFSTVAHRSSPDDLLSNDTVSHSDLSGYFKSGHAIVDSLATRDLNSLTGGKRILWIVLGVLVCLN